jgi:transposase
MTVLERTAAKSLAAGAPNSASHRLTPQAKIMQLIDLRGIGPVGGHALVNEAFYRDFTNRRQVGSYFGLTGTLATSGKKARGNVTKQ